MLFLLMNSLLFGIDAYFLVTGEGEFSVRKLYTDENGREVLVKSSRRIRNNDVIKITLDDEVYNSKIWKDKRFLKILQDRDESGNIIENENYYFPGTVNGGNSLYWIAVDFMLSNDILQQLEEVNIVANCKIEPSIMYDLGLFGDWSIEGVASFTKFYVNKNTVVESSAMLGTYHGIRRFSEVFVPSEGKYLLNLLELEENECLDKTFFTQKSVDLGDASSIQEYLGVDDNKLNAKIEKMADAISNNLEKAVIKARSSNLDGMINNFNNTCCKNWGKRRDCFDEFKIKLEELCSKHNVPVELMLGIMTIESGGRCNAIYNGSTKSYGLFQLVDVSGINWQNPEVIATSAIKLLVNKYKIVNEEAPRVIQSWENISDEDKDLWVRALFGYNAGQGNVQKIDNALATVNSEYNLNLDPRNYKDLVIGMFFARHIMGKKLPLVVFNYAMATDLFVYNWVQKLK